MNRSYLFLLVALTLGLGAKAALADTSSASPAPVIPTPTPSPTASPSLKLFQLGGEADFGFTQVDPNATLQFKNGGGARVFDTVANAPNVQDIYLAGTLIAGHLDGEFDISVGSDADVLHSFDQATNGFDVTQAYLSYAQGPVTVQAGKFLTLAGAETVRSAFDYQYSRSILFGYAVPFTHTGVRFTYAPNAKISVIAGENLGWDQFRQTSGNATTEAGIAFNPSPAISFSAQTYNGNENITLTPVISPAVGHRMLYDEILTIKPTSALTFVFNDDDATQTNTPLLDGNGALVSPNGIARWGGLAEYVNYVFTPKWSAALRGESFYDQGGYRTGLDQHWREGTFTAQYQPTPRLVLRAEYRDDLSNQDGFLRTNGSTDSTLGTFGLEAIAKF